MQIVEKMKALMMDTGSEWVMWLLIGLSVLSIAVIVERLFTLRSLRGDVDTLRRDLVAGLREGGFAKALAKLEPYRHPAAAVARTGLRGDQAETTVAQAKDAMAAEMVAQRRLLERRFAYLATLGANAPFIGLFGTVVGILQAFDALGQGGVGAPGQLAPQAIMGSISEALVATAIGLLVAIPAVFAFNMFERTVKSALDDAEILSLEVLSFLGAARPTGEPRPVEAPLARPRTALGQRGAAAVS
jgi:biopolymer transport protein ExbB